MPGCSYRLPGYFTFSWQTVDQLHVKVESLFRAGLDHLALELRPGIYLCSKLELPMVVGMNLQKLSDALFQV